MRETLQACCLVGLVFASPAVAQNAAPDDMKSPRLSAADVDWSGGGPPAPDTAPGKTRPIRCNPFNMQKQKNLRK
jgi:hypothetical protein